MRKPLEEFEVRGQHVLLGDCFDHMASLPDGAVDVVVTSPPYNIGTEYASFDDRSSRDDYLSWMACFFAEVARILHPQGSLFLNVSGSCEDPWVPMQVAAEAGAHLVLQNRIAWVKSISIGEESHGHFKPINSPRFLNPTFEDLFHFTHAGRTTVDRLAVGVPYAHKSNVDRWKGREPRDLRCAGSSWFIPYETIASRSRDRGDHPATFPVELASRCIRLHGVRPDLNVLDPFLGSGSTLVATLRLGLHGIGTEIERRYVDHAVERIRSDPS